MSFSARKGSQVGWSGAEFVAESLLGFSLGLSCGLGGASGGTGCCRKAGNAWRHNAFPARSNPRQNRGAYFNRRFLLPLRFGHRPEKLPELLAQQFSDERLGS